MTQAASPRIVVAKYYVDPWSDDDLTWLQYLQERGNDSPADGGRGTSQAIYNPYDYRDPNSLPKDMKDSPPFSQRYDEMGGEYGVTYGPKLYNEEEGILKDWVKARRTDWTEDPTEQSPAMSADRKYASMELEAATLKEVVNKDYHYKNDEKLVRAGQVDLRQVGDTQESMLKGLFEFTWNSKSPMAGQPKVVFQFLRPKGRLRPKSYLDYPVQMGCNCGSFLYYGAQYYAVHGKYMYMPMFRPSLVPPVPQTMISRVRPGKGINFRVCKHVLAAYNWFESKGLRILMHYRRYPTQGAPAKVMNAKEWERLMGFPFTLEEVKRRLSSSRSLPRFFSTNFFRTRQQSDELEEWFQDTWVNRGEHEKMRVLDTLVEHPEEIFYLLVKDANESPTKLSQTGIEKAFELMSRVVQPDNDQEPQGKSYKRPGTRAVIPGKDMGEEGGPDVKPSKGYEPTYKSVKPAVKDVEGPTEEDKAPEEEMTPEEEKKMERFSPPKKKKDRSWFKENEPGYVPPLKAKYRQTAKKPITREACSNVIQMFYDSMEDKSACL